MASLTAHGARTRQLSELRTEVQYRADIENDSHVTAAELTRYINQSIARLYWKLVRLRGDAYYRVSSDLSVSAETVAVPSDFFKLLGMQWVYDGTRRQRVRRVELQEWLEWDHSLTGWSAGRDIRVMIEKALFRFWPTPNATETVRCWYLPAPAELSLDTDVFDGIAGFEEVVIVDAAIKAKTKRDEPVADLVSERKELMSEIETIASDVDHGDPAYVIDRQPAIGRDWPDLG